MFSEQTDRNNAKVQTQGGSPFEKQVMAIFLRKQNQQAPFLRTHKKYFEKKPENISTKKQVLLFNFHNGCDKQILEPMRGLSSNMLDHWFHEMLIFSNHQKH